jgi:23S rRNA (uracil1939-C5)-methyltransferase
MSKKPKIIGKNVELDIHTLGQKGDGIATWDEKNAQVYIDGAMVGEKIKVTITKGHDEILRGKITDISQLLSKAPERVDPKCSIAYKCGGCGLQHMQQQFYKDWKVQRVKDIFERAEIAPRHWHDDIFIPAATRRRAHFTLLKQNNNLLLGFREKRSHNILNANECLVLEPKLYDDAQKMRPYLARIARDSRVLNMFIQATDSGYDIVLTGEVGAKGDPDLSVHEGVAEMINALPIARIAWRRREREEAQLLLEKNPLLHSFGELSVTLPAMAFMQPSRQGEDALCNAMLGGISKYARKNEALKIADLFAGNGTLTGRLLGLGSVSGFESDSEAVKALKMGLLRTGQDHQAFKRDLFKEPLDPDELDKFDVIVMDPPRAGAKSQSENLAKLADITMDEKCLIYISCNPASFARDAKKMSDAGWTFETAQIIDQFIWSDHIELCGVFTL